MVGKRRATLILLLILSFGLASFPQIDTSKAESTIYIRADGSVEGTDNIQRNGDIYTFTGDISGWIQVQSNNIIIEGTWHTLQGDGEMGLETVGCKNVTIRNLNIKDFTRGIRFTNSSDCIVHHNVIVNNSIGIEMGYVDRSYSSNNTVNGNIIEKNRNAGIRLIYGSSNTVFGNILTENNEGISIWGTSGNNIVWNNITSNNRGIYLVTSGINIIHHNNFVDNINDWWDYGYTPWPFQLPFSENVWDDGKEGNYWGKYPGTDINGDGIGDSSYVLYRNNTDNFPRMQPIEVPIEIPEFPSWTPLLIMLLSVTTLAVIYKRRIQNQERKNPYLPLFYY
jgi:parallel beta-helix repeat protein